MEDPFRNPSNKTTVPIFTFFSQNSMLLRSEDDLTPTRLLLSPQFVDEENSVAEKPFLTMASTYSTAVSGSILRTDNGSSVSLISDEMGRQLFRAGMVQSALGMFLFTRLGLHVFRSTRLGYRLILRVLALCIYGLLLSPGILQVAYRYIFSSKIHRDIVYGDQPRNRLDLYLPENRDNSPKPVVAFVTGGAWIIGYKAWGCLLGQQLAERGIIVACIDYRNFPQGMIGDMVNDASHGIAYVCNHIAEYGGDPNRIYIMGQSAGAHIAACALIEQAIKEVEEGDSTSWSLSQIKAYFGLSGGYNMFNLVDHFQSRGLYRSIFFSIMEGEESLQKFSPEIRVQDPSIADAVSSLPPFVLFHGTGDYSIPSESSISFANTLQGIGVKAEAILYEGKTHTDVFLQDPMRGGEDELFHDLVANIYDGDEQTLERDALAAPPRKRLVPEFLLKLAHSVSPF
ncbi:isoprenylcysteine alpha-carbonyl methylesterase ICME-like [Impatiens glandulifera]|uniref:isoprenylcysteine alpha-carbonyl methylesterase ICME-like n=1 Tax=Impatiens glandulifera TaxID=253017 RepID=UPI001FB0BB59|nr:isoprenylcysteine alpha-carbonyl methylesterase ICME-like [Impatiens glandulifera]